MSTAPSPRNQPPACPPWDEPAARALAAAARAGCPHAADALALAILPVCTRAVAAYARRHTAEWRRPEDREEAALEAAAVATRWAIAKHDPTAARCSPINAAAAAIAAQRASNHARARRLTAQAVILAADLPAQPASAHADPLTAAADHAHRTTAQPTATSRTLAAAMAALPDTDPPAAAVAAALAAGCRTTSRALARATGYAPAECAAAALRLRATLAAAGVGPRARAIG